MTKAIFVTATGTDVGKTYISELILKKLRSMELNAGYYKAAVSGVDILEESDMGRVKKTANLNCELSSMVSYVYKNAYSPHLAAKIEGNNLEMDKIKSDWNSACKKYGYIVVEGSGGIICPLRFDNKKIMLEDVVKELNLSTIVVGDAGLGTINSTVLTIEYLKSKSIDIKGIVINNYSGGVMQEDNIKMIKELTNIPIISIVETNCEDISIDEDMFLKLFKEVK